MTTPLSPLPSHTLNAKSSSPGTPQPGAASLSPAGKDVEPPTAAADEGDMTIWDDAPSSPFLSDVVDQENRAAAGRSPSKQRSPSKTAPISSPTKEQQPPPPQPVEAAVEDTVEQTPMKSSEKPSFDILDDGHLEVEATPRPNDDASPSKFYTPAPLVASPSKSSYAAEEPTLRENEGLTITMKQMEMHRSEMVSTEFSASTYHETEGDANIDDTCFSTFSEVPNVDMTAFAKIGARDMVSLQNWRPVELHSR
jgi:hypothetical protein